MRSYFIASCGGVTVSVLKKYIEKQDSQVGKLRGIEPSTFSHTPLILSDRRDSTD